MIKLKDIIAEDWKKLNEAVVNIDSKFNSELINNINAINKINKKHKIKIHKICHSGKNSN